MKTKSLGLAVVLTLFFGPLGLFYASISGGLIMCLIPVILTIIVLSGLAAGNLFVIAGSALLIYLFGISYWIICVIWAATAVSNHNNKVMNDARQAELIKLLNETKASDTPTIQHIAEKQLSRQEHRSDPNRPTYQEWRKDNPHKSLNDYYRIYGTH